MDAQQAKAYMAEHREGTFTLLDVRQPGEYERERIPGAKHIPLPELTNRLDELDPTKPIIAYWAVGGRSRAAAQLLAGKGFEDIYNLKGGIKAWQGLTTAGPADRGMSFVKGDEPPQEIIVLAYGMEKGLGEFYTILSEQTNDKEVTGLFINLAGIEEIHKQKLFNLYLTIDSSISDKETFESKIVEGVMEGGFTTSQFLEQNRPAMQTIPDVLNIAMMLEAQAMDLYMRYSQKVGDEKSKKILYEISEEEKAHLGSLGRLLDVKG